MKKNFTRFLRMKAIVIMALFVFIGCEKSTGSLGLELVVDSKAVLGLKRDIPVITYTVKFDSINATNTKNAVAGFLEDPSFGIVKNEFVTQMQLKSFSPEFGDSAVVDSVVMLIAYSGYYGDTNKTMTFKVVEIEEQLDADSNYYSNYVFEEGVVMGSYTFSPKPNERTILENDEIPSALKIPLDNNWAYTRIINPARLDKQYFADNRSFIEYFKGVKVRTESNDGCALYFNLLSPNSLIRIYYRSNPLVDSVSSRFDLLHNDFITNINTATFDYTNAEFDLDDQDSIGGEQDLYVQPMGGVATVIDLSALEDYKDSAFIVNRAEMVVHLKSGSGLSFAPPSEMIMIEDKNGSKVLVKDLLIGSGNFGGKLESDFLRNRKYVFNLTKQVNDYINTESVINKIYMIPGNSSSVLNRAILGGNNNSQIPVEFKLYFTRTN